jgi:hypothetical protein
MLTLRESMPPVEVASVWLVLGAKGTVPFSADGKLESSPTQRAKMAWLCVRNR